jgi:hypothetical protein
MSTENRVKLRPIEDGFTVQWSGIDERRWTEIVEQFDDANIYQSWPYAEVLSGRSNMAHLVLFRGGAPVAGVQARIQKLPLVPAGIAYVRWGPMWRRRNADADPGVLRNILRAMRNEFNHRRGLVLRVNLNLSGAAGLEAESVLEEEGYSWLGAGSRGRTILYDITPSIEELKEGMKAHWRRELKVAEKNQLEVVEGDSLELFDEFIQIYKEMVSRKKFKEPNDINQFRELQSRLPASLKMRILLARTAGVTTSGLIYSAMGNSAIYLFGATSDGGLKSRGSYWLQWRALHALKSSGVSVYNLNGINPEKNPGTYKFKNDLAGTFGSDVHYLGQFDAPGSFMSRAVVGTAEELRRRYHQYRSRPSDVVREEKKAGTHGELANTGGN